MTARVVGAETCLHDRARPDMVYIKVHTCLTICMSGSCEPSPHMLLVLPTHKQYCCPGWTNTQQVGAQLACKCAHTLSHSDSSQAASVGWHMHAPSLTMRMPLPQQPPPRVPCNTRNRTRSAHARVFLALQLGPIANLSKSQFTNPPNSPLLGRGQSSMGTLRQQHLCVSSNRYVCTPTAS